MDNTNSRFSEAAGKYFATWSRKAILVPIYIGRPQLAEQSIVALGCTVCEECFTTATFVVVVVVVIVAGLLLLRSIIVIVVFMRRNHNFLSALPSDLPSE
jgi:uncharacterized membrane protein YdbT with pleckstrin-like domain